MSVGEIVVLVIVCVAFVAAVAALIVRKCKGKSGCDCGGSCSECGGACPHCVSAQTKDARDCKKE